MINESIINFAVYEDSTEYLGVAKATLPELVNKVISVEGAGIAGTYESVIPGHIEPMTLGLDFRTINKNALSLLEQRNHQIELRVPQQDKNTTSGAPVTVDVKYVFIVQPKKLNLGNVAPASTGDVSGEYSVTYVKALIGGKVFIEIDILNSIYFINGKDYLADVRRALGKT